MKKKPAVSAKNLELITNLVRFLNKRDEAQQTTKIHTVSGKESNKIDYRK
ncbi:MAG: hypothetical protein LBS21_04755 [Clostridiales bacterium]|nr:hypothetical protein [Clostridiales bacterium]